MLCCNGLCGPDADEAEREPLLDHSDHDTTREARLHEKLHTYQMGRAISKGYMPSNRQCMGHLKASLQSTILSPPPDAGLSPTGQALIRTSRLWMKQLIELFESKNSKDQIQDLIWCLYKTGLNTDPAAITQDIVNAKHKADVKATAEGLKTFVSLLFTNSDFRVFAADLGTISRQVLRDAATTLGDVSTKAGKQLDTSKTDIEALKETDKQDPSETSPEDVKEEASHVAEAVQDGIKQVGDESVSSVEEHMTPEARQILKNRLKEAVMSLNKKKDYTESVSVVTNLLKRCLHIYTSIGTDAAHAAQDELGDGASQAVYNFWLLVSSFGNKEYWEEAKVSFRDFMDKHGEDENLDGLLEELATLFNKLLTQPSVLDNVEDRLGEMREKLREMSSETSLGDDANRVLGNMTRAIRSVLEDEHIRNLTSTSLRMIDLVSSAIEKQNHDLEKDFFHTLLPSMIEAIQFIPIPRVEVSTPPIDLLIENLILEPGHTVNASSFLPYKLGVSNQNDLDISKARFGTASSMNSTVTVKIAGLSIVANDLGYWMSLHSGIFYMVDEGIASFHLDEKGIDITLEMEIGRERLEELVTLKNVDVQIHHLDYTLSKSKFACLAWCFKPILRPLIKKALESKISAAIEENMHMLNREFVFARERLRATRICGPSDLWTFIRAVAARLVPEQDPDVETSIGVKPNIFKGKYAPGSLVKVFEEEARLAEQNVFEYKRDGWRNDIFNVAAGPTMHPDGQ